MTAAKQAQRTPGPWYEAKTGNHQGLIISEQTGANIAVTYDATDAPFIVRACNSHDDLLMALRDIELVLHPDADEHSPLVRGTREWGEVIQNIVNAARAAIAKAEA